MAPKKLALFCILSLAGVAASIALSETCDLEAPEDCSAETNDVSLLQTNILVQPKSSKIEAGVVGVSDSPTTGVSTHASVHSKLLPVWMPSTTAELMHSSKAALLYLGGGGGVHIHSSSPAPDLRAGMFEVLGLLGVVLVLFVATTLMLPWIAEESRDLAQQWLEICLCFVLLTLAFCSYGVVQEYIMTMDYNGQTFPSSVFLIFANRIAVISLAAAVLIIKGQSLWMDASKWASIPALTVFAASFCQYESLRYVTFPTQVVFKSCKIVPTMIMASVMNAQQHGWFDYLYAAIITACVSGFTVASESRESDSLGPSWIGILMLGVFLCCDALTSNSEKKIFNAWQGFEKEQMMLAVGFWTFMFSAVSVASSISFGVMATFFAENPEAVAHVIGLSVCSAAGQYLVFYVIKHYGPVVFAIMMTVRQMFSIVLSTILFGHEMGALQIGCASMCFLVMLLKPLLKPAKESDKKPATVAKPDANLAADSHLQAGR